MEREQGGGVGRGEENEERSGMLEKKNKGPGGNLIMNNYRGGNIKVKSGCFSRYLFLKFPMPI